ncbi:MAG: response regulator [Myxococcales bacterium]|nr:response regulator [Myxococcales bacterium]
MPARIVVVDDDSAICEALCDVLGDAGYDVVAFANGREAMGALTPRPALFIIDLMMPELDGWELIDELKRTAPLADIPICVMSAIGNTHSPPKVAAVLPKPVALDTLLETVATLLGQS